MDDKAHDTAFTLASTLRRQGLWVEFDARGGSLKSQMKRADKLGARFALVLGENELAQQSGELKPMAGGDPRKVGFAELATALRAG